MPNPRVAEAFPGPRWWVPFEGGFRDVAVLDPTPSWGGGARCVEIALGRANDTQPFGRLRTTTVAFLFGKGSAH